MLASSYDSPDDPAGVAAAWDSHVWCARAGGGAVAISFGNMLGTEVNVTLPAGVASNRRLEYVLTSSPVQGASSVPPASLYGNVSHLNGERLFVLADGSLPQWPLPGRLIDDGSSIVVPAWSIGLIVALDANAAACSGGARESLTR